MTTAKNNNYKLGLIKITENTPSTPFIDDILSNEINIIRKSANVKDYIVKEDVRSLIYAVMQMDRYALNFVGKKIDGFVNTEPKYAKCDIVFSTALYPDDETTVDTLIEKLNIEKIRVKQTLGD